MSEPSVYQPAMYDWLNYSAPNRTAEYCDKRVCLSVFVHDDIFGRNTTCPIFNVFCVLPMAEGSSCPGGLVISYRYVFLVLSMTSCLHIS